MPDKALLVGINTYASINSLQGCVNDVTNVRHILMTYFGFESQHIRVVTDARAVKASVLDGFSWLTENAQPGDRLVFHYSGHGSYTVDSDGDESDNTDELICLYNMDWNNPESYLIDDELRRLCASVPSGVDLTVLLDSCHSGTGTRDFDLIRQYMPRSSRSDRWPVGTTSGDEICGPLTDFSAPVPIDRYQSLQTMLPFLRTSRFAPPPIDIVAQVDERRQINRQRLRGFEEGAMNHVLLAGCQDTQTSADAYIDGSFNGAFTYYFCKGIRDHGASMSFNQAMGIVRQSLTFHGYDQIPQCEGKNLDAPLFGVRRTSESAEKGPARKREADSVQSGFESQNTKGSAMSGKREIEAGCGTVFTITLPGIEMNEAERGFILSRFEKILKGEAVPAMRDSVCVGVNLGPISGSYCWDVNK